MNRLAYLFACLILLAFASCQRNGEPTGEVAATLNLSSNENAVWRNNTTRAAAAEPATMDIYYVLDANGICQTAAKVDHATPATADKLLAFGDYSVFCITNADPIRTPIFGFDDRYRLHRPAHGAQHPH